MKLVVFLFLIFLVKIKKWGLTTHGESDEGMGHLYVCRSCACDLFCVMGREKHVFCLFL